MHLGYFFLHKYEKYGIKLTEFVLKSVIDNKMLVAKL